MSEPRRLVPAQPLDEEGRALAEKHVRLAYILVRKARATGADDLRYDDLLAEAMYALVYAAGHFRRDRKVPFGAFATMVIKHRLMRAVSRMRAQLKKRRSIPADDSLADPVSNLPEEALQSIDARQACERARQYLPARLFDILWMRLGEGRTLESIGARYGFSRQRALFLVRKAEKRLRHRFPDWGSRF